MNNIGYVLQKDNERTLSLVLGEHNDPNNKTLQTLLKYGIKLYRIVLLHKWEEDYKDKFWVIPIKIKGQIWYADCSNILGSSVNNETMTFIVDRTVIENIEATIKKLEAYQKNLFEGNKQLKKPLLEKFDYDISISFAGEDRSIAKAIATKLHEENIRVFYDDFEKANLWGKDLVLHLDEVYRKKARYCIIIASSYYKQKIWTNHELKSALARSIQQQEEYILPIVLDDTEIPGIRPTTGYIKYQDEKDINIIVDLVQQKLKQHINVVHNSNFSPKWLENLVDINRKWDIDCLAFCIDPRYIEIDGDQSRLAVSYGINYTEIRQGILAPSSQKGKTVFGIHNVVIQNGYKLNLCDKWIDSIEGENFDTLQEAVKKGFQILSEINNEEYLRLVDFYGEKGAFGVSQRYFLDEFDIHTDIG